MATRDRELLDTRPLAFDRLVAPQQVVVGQLTEWMADRVGAAEAELRGKRELADELPWARLDLNRMVNVVSISGPRGTGKSTVLLSTLLLWQAARAREWGEVEPKGGSPADTARRWKGTKKHAQDFAGKVLALPVLDFDPLPDELPIFSWVLQAFRPLIEELHGGRDSALTDEWQALFRAATSGWDNARLTRGQRDVAEGVLDREIQVGDWHSLHTTWERFLNRLFEEIPRSDRMRGAAPSVIVLPVDDLDLQVERLRQCLHTFRLLTDPRVVFLCTMHREHLVDVLSLEEVGRMFRLGGQAGADLPDLDPPMDEPPEVWAKEIGQAMADKVVRKDATYGLSRLNLEDVLAWRPGGSKDPWLGQALKAQGTKQPLKDDRLWALGLNPDEPLAEQVKDEDSKPLDTFSFLSRWSARQELGVCSLRELVQFRGRLLDRERAHAEFGATGEAVVPGIQDVWDLVTGRESSWREVSATILDGVDRPRRFIYAEGGATLNVGGVVRHRELLNPGREASRAPRYGVPDPRALLGRDLAWLYDRRTTGPYLNGPFLLWTTWADTYPGVIAAWPIPLFPECPFEVHWVQELWRRFEPQREASVVDLAYAWVRFWLAAMRRADVPEPFAQPDAAAWDRLLDHVWLLTREAEGEMDRKLRGQGQGRMTDFAYRRLPLLGAPEYGLPRWLRQKLLSRTSQEAGERGKNPEVARSTWRAVFSGDRIERLRSYARWDPRVVDATVGGPWGDGGDGTGWAGSETERRVSAVSDGLWEMFALGLPFFRAGNPRAQPFTQLLPSTPSNARVGVRVIPNMPWFPTFFPALDTAAAALADDELTDSLAPMENLARAGTAAQAVALWQVLMRWLSPRTAAVYWIRLADDALDTNAMPPLVTRLHKGGGPIVRRESGFVYTPHPGDGGRAWRLEGADVPDEDQSKLVEALMFTQCLLADAQPSVTLPRLSIERPSKIDPGITPRGRELTWPSFAAWLDHELFRVRVLLMRAALDGLPEGVSSETRERWVAAELLYTVAALTSGTRTPLTLEVQFADPNGRRATEIVEEAASLRDAPGSVLRAWIRENRPALSKLLGNELSTRLLGEPRPTHKVVR